MQGPRGTRDLYPAEAARRRWITERWREVAVRHGFEEVDGPTFEESELYAVKSGEGILGELFQAYSGKSPDEVERVKATGRAPYAMRPEFTPTLARMYAARAAGLSKPCKWFQIGPFFRAERPQRGRLREFLQWNVDLLGGEAGSNLNEYDAEVISVLAASFASFGMSPADTRIKIGSRRAVLAACARYGAPPHLYGPDDLSPSLLRLLDDRLKITPDEFERRAVELALPDEFVKYCHPVDRAVVPLDATVSDIANIFGVSLAQAGEVYADYHQSGGLSECIRQSGFAHWCEYDSMVVRGLAYYTSNVFEAIAEGERAVAGGGRYDNLVKLFGGPPTPAVGFAMGDVVLANLLQDKELMPSDAELMGLVGQTPDVFVLSNGDEGAERQVRPLVAALRRGSRAPQDSGLRTQDSGLKAQDPLHVRHSYKATKNVGKLLKEAAQVGARFAVIVESAAEATVKDLRTGEPWADRVPIGDVGRRIAERVRGG